MRQFVADRALDSKGCLLVEEKNFKYLAGVLRTSVGDMIYVRLPDGSLQNMTVAKIDHGRKQMLLQVAGEKAESQNLRENNAKPQASGNGLELVLFQFIAKPPKMEQIIRQAVECGVSCIVPVEGAFCQAGNVESARKRSLEKDGRWQKIVVEACQQSGSPVHTEITPCMTVGQAADFWKSRMKNADDKGSVAVVLDEMSESTVVMHRAVSRNRNASMAACAVGAEGGISRDEIALLKDAGFVSVHFLTNILRCETASLYGIGALQTVLLEKEEWQSKE